MPKFIKLCMLFVMLVACDTKNDNLSELVIMTSQGPIVYQVETADTKEKMSQGLMNRKTLRADSGMIFDLGGVQEIAMWMKDTYISLDMLFVNKDGRIIWIYKNAEPQSTRLIKPRVNDLLYAVIEVNAGDVEKKGIKVGDTIRHKILSK